MRRMAVFLLGGLLLAGCAQGAAPQSGGGSSGSTAAAASGAGTGVSTSGAINASYQRRDDGAGLVTLRGGGTLDCLAKFAEPPAPLGNAVAPMACSNGNNGTAILQYDAQSEPETLTYSLGAGGSGSVDF